MLFTSDQSCLLKYAAQPNPPHLSCNVAIKLVLLCLELCSTVHLEYAVNDKSTELHNYFIRTELSIAVYKDLLS